MQAQAFSAALLTPAIRGKCQRGAVKGVQGPRPLSCLGIPSACLPKGQEPNARALVGGTLGMEPSLVPLGYLVGRHQLLGF